MVTLVNRAKMSTSTTGTGTITLGSAETGYQSFADAGVTDGDVVRYVIEDGDDWEIGSGTYTATGTTLSRTVDESSNSDAALNLTGSAVVFITAAAEDVFQGELFAESPSSPTAPSATGTNAVAIGTGSVSSGSTSVAIGDRTEATANQTVAIGSLNTRCSSIQGVAIGSARASGLLGSVAIGGYGSGYSVASNNYSIALGRSYSSGDASFAAAITNNTSSYGATGANSIAIGDRAISSGSSTISIGTLSQSTSFESTAVGKDSRATGNSSTAVGKYARASGIGAAAFGAGAYSETTTASGDYSLALGYSNSASGARSVVIGKDATSAYADSFAIGNNTTATAINQITLGSTSDTVRISSAYTLPTSDGTNGQVLTTDGSGAVTFADAGGGGADLYAADTSGTPTDPSATGTNAIAIGNGATAAGNYGIGIGFVSDATGNQSSAIGYNADATGLGSVAIGFQPDAKSSYSTAIGANSSGAGSQAVTNAGAMALGGSYASGTDSFAAAITSNSSSYGATGSNSIAIGRQSKASGSSSIAIGSFRAYALGSQSIALGNFSTANSTYAVSIGSSVTADITKAFALGYEAKSSIKGKFSYSASAFSAAGDAQTGIFVLRSDTTDATAEAMTTDNSAGSTDDQIILPNNSAYAFHGTIVARQQAADGTACAAWKVEGLIRREGSASTTVLVNSATTVLDNTPSWGLALSADTTNGGLKVEATGAAATDIRWVATIHTSEVTYA